MPGHRHHPAHGVTEVAEPRRGEAVDELVTLMAAEPGMAQRLLAVHTDDGTGRCRVCTSGAQAARQHWPCPLHGLAERAIKLTQGGPD